jgi:hypothetical protein
MEIAKAVLAIKSTNLLMHVLAGGLKENTLTLSYNTKSDKMEIVVDKLAATKAAPSYNPLKDEYQCITALLDVKKSSSGDRKLIDSAILRFMNYRDMGWFTDTPSNRQVFKQKSGNLSIVITELFKHEGATVYV